MHYAEQGIVGDGVGLGLDLLRCRLREDEVVVVQVQVLFPVRLRDEELAGGAGLPDLEV